MPIATLDTLVLVVSGAGTGTSTLDDVQCAGSTVHAAVASGGQLSLDLSTGVLQVTAVDPVGNLTLSGTAHRTASDVTYAGTATGTIASMHVTC